MCVYVYIYVCVCVCVCVYTHTHKYIHGLPSYSVVKNLPAMQEMWVQCLGWEYPLENEMAIYSSILAWEIPRTEEPGGLQSTGLQESHLT